MGRSLYLTYGGDFEVTPQGGLRVAENTPSEQTSTNQRVERLLRTSPAIKDELGRVIARGDSLFYRDFGVGIGRYVDASMGSTEIAELRGAILDGLSQEPDIIRQPAPVVTISFADRQTLTISIQYTGTTGLTYSTPDYSFPFGG